MAHNALCHHRATARPALHAFVEHGAFLSPTPAAVNLVRTAIVRHFIPNPPPLPCPDAFIWDKGPLVCVSGVRGGTGTLRLGPLPYCGPCFSNRK